MIIFSFMNVLSPYVFIIQALINLLKNFLQKYYSNDRGRRIKHKSRLKKDEKCQKQNFSQDQSMMPR